MALSISQRIIAEKIGTIFLLEGKDNDDIAMFVYIGVEGTHLEQFLQAIDNNNFNPENYGIILASGMGIPTPWVKKQIEEKFNITFD